MNNICGKETLKRALDVMDFEQIYQLYKEYSDDSCGTEYAFGCPYYVEDKESGEVADFIGEYLEKNHLEELNKALDAESDEADMLGEIEHFKKKTHPEKINCEYCKEEKPFLTLNCCENCFDKETDKYYSEDE